MLPLFLETSCASYWRLEVDASRELNDAPARIVCGRDVAIGKPHSTEAAVRNSRRRAARRAADRRRGVGGVLDAEIDVVEGIQKFRAELEVDLLRDLGSLDQAQIKPREV